MDAQTMAFEYDVSPRGDEIARWGVPVALFAVAGLILVGVARRRGESEAVVEQESKAEGTPVRDVGKKEYISPAPAGFARATGKLPPEAGSWARSLLGNPYGTNETATLSDGKAYYAVVESHYDDHVPDAQGERYPRWHPGVSLFVKG